MERFVLLPFTMGCVSESSIAIGAPQPKGSKLDVNQTPTRTHDEEKEEEEDEYEEDEENIKSPLSLLALPRVQKLFKNFKNFSHLFVEKDEMEEGDTGMEIGHPTDIKHVTHIGLDGCATSILSKGWDNFTQPPDHDDQLVNLTLNFPQPTPFDQLLMATQADTVTSNMKSNSLQNQMQKSS
ncbi:CRIB domain-containing protein RIC4 [Abeliophyllum distichum]|uniref:CRIB domain-containing protein RIC4 n=1 Tax=Abeliophyllum distichum TaxID=126358 RepID=A0ABD1VQS2_9LAMI